MVLTAYFALSPVIGLCCHRRPQETCKKLLLENLTPTIEASGPHDFAVRVSAFVRAKCLRCVLPRPPHPLPYVRDDRETPLCVGRDANDKEVIWVKRKCKYFCKEDWTGK
jgi:hypothetical protein